MKSKSENQNTKSLIYIKNDSFQMKKQFNYGLAILKSYLAFLVVLSHQFSKKTTKNKIILKLTKKMNYHVPCFFIMSFYLMCNNLISFNANKIIKRFIRLFIPYIGWPFIILLINKIYNKNIKKKFPESFETLKLQLMWGTAYIGQFWFQWDLIVTTLIFVVIIFIFRKHYLFILQFLLLLFYYFQYTGNYFKKFLHLNKNNIYTIGRMFEMIPLGITGFTLGFYDIISRLHKFKFKTLFFSLLIEIFINNYKIFTIIGGLVYQGIELNIKSVCIIFIFSVFPSEIIKNTYLKKYILLITKYSAGIFYLHISIRDYLIDHNDNIKKGTFIGSIINYFICYSISLFGDSIFGKTPLKYLFC